MVSPSGSLADGADLGFAFDGDGDRVIAVDDKGKARDGDELLALVATELARRGALGGGVAVTVMSNYGFHRAMADAGIEVATTAVGDRHVSAALIERGWALGGEQSGHLIWTEAGRTGDGIAAALLVMSALGDRDLADAIPMEKLPQTARERASGDRDARGQRGSERGGHTRIGGAGGPRPSPSATIGHRTGRQGNGRGPDSGRSRRGAAARLAEVVERELC